MLSGSATRASLKVTSARAPRLSCNTTSVVRVLRATALTEHPNTHIRSTWLPQTTPAAAAAPARSAVSRTLAGRQAARLRRRGTLRGRATNSSGMLRASADGLAGRGVGHDLRPAQDQTRALSFLQTYEHVDIANLLGWNLAAGAKIPRRP